MIKSLLKARDPKLHKITDIVFIFISSVHKVMKAGKEGLDIERNGAADKDEIIIGFFKSFFGE